jgi:hypothetical protein
VGARVVIEQRFRGPPHSGQGGYSCGLVAAEIDGPAVVSLRRPPPLERPLDLDRKADGLVALLDGEELVAEGRSATVELELPPVVTLQAAREARPRPGILEKHPYPGCFGCGPDRAEGDALRMFAGVVPGREELACVWTPDRSLADANGDVAEVFVWAALDCPSGWAPAAAPPMVLARLAARIDSPVRAGVPYIAMAWEQRREGRKHFTACLLASDADGPVAVSEALWIELREPSLVGARV